MGRTSLITLPDPDKSAVLPFEALHTFEDKCLHKLNAQINIQRMIFTSIKKFLFHFLSVCDFFAIPLSPIV